MILFFVTKGNRVKILILGIGLVRLNSFSFSDSENIISMIRLNLNNLTLFCLVNILHRNASQLIDMHNKMHNMIKIDFMLKTASLSYLLLFV